MSLSRNAKATPHRVTGLGWQKRMLDACNITRRKTIAVSEGSKEPAGQFECGDFCVARGKIPQREKALRGAK
jgi:hypothetical protein